MAEKPKIMKTKKKKIKILHPKAKLFRSSDPSMSVFMWGINYMGSEMQHIQMPVMLLPEHFKAFTKVKVENKDFNKETMPSHYKFKIYFPVAFKIIRERFGTDDSVYVRSLTNREPSRVMPNSGRSTRLMSTSDERFVVKTIGGDEVGQLHALIRPYYEYLVTNSSGTFLPHILGLYRVTVGEQDSYYFVMGNAFERSYTIKVRYDLKGSTFDRQASEKEKQRQNPTYKDVDFVESQAKLWVGAQQKAQILSTLQRDVDFLSSQNLMDYSLLVGIHDCEAANLAEKKEDLGEESAPEYDYATASSYESEEEQPQQQLQPAASAGSEQAPPSTPPPQGAGASAMPTASERSNYLPRVNMFPSSPDAPKREIYFLMIIDVLTNYGVKKWTAHTAKTIKHGADAEFSTVAPESYAKRFIDFIGSILA